MFLSNAKIMLAEPADEESLISSLQSGVKTLSAGGWGTLSEHAVTDITIDTPKDAAIFALTTCTGKTLHCTPGQLCFAKFAPSQNQNVLYLHERSTLGYRIALSDNIFRDLTDSAPSRFHQREITDKIWILDTSTNNMLSIFMLKYVASKYGIPDVPFILTYTANSLNEEFIKQIFDRIDTPARARELLQDSCMFFEYPHITVRYSNDNSAQSNSVQLIVFGGNEISRNGEFSHLINISSLSDLSKIEKQAILCKNGNNSFWLLEMTREDLEEAELFVKTLSHLDNLEIVRKVQLTKQDPFYILPASHIKPGMTVPVISGTKKTIMEDTVQRVEILEAPGQRYRVSAGKASNIICNGWVVMCSDASE
ncbi:MAG: hypothetical protein GX221_01245 [Candidatus Riflebacteria bacterium]|nr:hypothetical protein [Candidatus Riflebacteria bacterium]